MGTAPVVESQATNNTPDFRRKEVDLFARARDRCRDLMTGTDAIHEAGTKYLPKWPGEDDKNYKVRATITEVYGAFQRCVAAARGLVGARPPKLSDGAPPIIEDHWKDIDGEGTHAEVFIMRQFEEGLVDGPVFLLIEYPAVDPAALPRGLADAQQMQLRPHWVRVTADQIVNWRTSKVGGKTMLTAVTIHEEVDEPTGDFGVQCIEQYRAIRMETVQDGITGQSRPAITYQIWRKRPSQDDEKVDWFIYDEGEYKGPKRIPLAIGYLGRKMGMLVAEPPLSALAELNIGHYLVSADRRYLMSICHAPTFVLEGWVDPVPSSDTPPGQASTAMSAEIALGPNSVIKTPPNCKATWVQASPNGLTASKEEKDDLVAQMASMSIAFLQQQRKSQETATAHRINSIAQNATLATAARGLKDLIDDALEIHCQYLEGIETPPTVTVNTVYDEDQLDAQTIQALDQVAKDGNMTRGTLLLILQRGNVIPEDVDLDEEEAELDGQERERNDSQAQALANAHLVLANSLAGGKSKPPTGPQPSPDPETDQIPPEIPAA